MWKEQTVNRHNKRSTRCDLHWNTGIFNCCQAADRCGHKTNYQACDDPSDSAEHTDRRKLFFRIGHLAKRDGVCKRKRRHITNSIAQQNPEEQRRVSDSRGPIHQDSSSEMKDCQNFLRGEKSVRYHPHKQRTYQCRDPRRAVSQSRDIIELDSR